MAKGKKQAEALSLVSLPALPSIGDIQGRLARIFPESFSDRTILVGLTAARVVFVFSYGGFVEGHGRFLRPSYIYLFTAEQAELTNDEDRQHWLSTVRHSGHRVAGTRWYADNSRETIRDDLMRNQLLRLGILHKLPGIPTTSSVPIYYLAAGFAALFSPSLSDEDFVQAAEIWRTEHLGRATLQRMALKAQGIQAKTGDVFIEMPDGSRIRVAAGPSTDILKGLIEDYAPRHMKKPQVLWISSSDKKSYPQYVEWTDSVGLTFGLNNELPDLILLDMSKTGHFVFCEIVATDGAVTEARKEALLSLIRLSKIPVNEVKFLTAFEDRGAAPFRKNFSSLALNTMVWFRTEPDLLVILSIANKDELNPTTS